LNQIKQDHQRDLMNLKVSLQSDLNEKLNKAMESLHPPEIEFPKITVDTTAEELIRILTTRLQNLEVKVHHQNQIIESFQSNADLEKQKSEHL
jgi:hypothetical protein